MDNPNLLGKLKAPNRVGSMRWLGHGDYVLATKHSDGDPLDGWCVGFYKEPYLHCGYDQRHIVVDNDGNSFRANGFRRVKKISKERGEWIIKNQKIIETSGFSMWHFARCSMKWPNDRR